MPLTNTCSATVIAVELTFLGTGAAFSPSAYNASILIDRTILLDAGAPLAVHLPKAGLTLDDPRSVLVSHFHADHTFGLAALMLGRVLANENTPSLKVFGPVGTASYLQRLLDLAWGEDMRRLTWDRLQLAVTELQGGDAFEVEGSKATAFRMRHSSRMNCLGFVIERDGLRLGYTGDAELSPELESLVAASDHVISEMTYDAEAGAMHLARRDVEALMQRHPGTRFIITHRGSHNGEVRGAVMARDFQTLTLPLR
jgi:ribonuclease Z